MSKKENKIKHANAIKKKYFLDGKRLFIKHGNMYWTAYHANHGRHQPKIYISDEEISVSGYNEICTPHTLDKYLKLVKEGKMILNDLDNNVDYDNIDDYLREKMILKIAGVE